jgi:hypothetical protein
MISQFLFSQQRFPSMPVLQVVFVSSEVDLQTASLTATIDTGADASFVPLALLEEILAQVGKSIYASSLWGERQEFSSFVVDVRIGNLTFPGVQVVGYDGDEIILGRDVLNKLRLLLDGPAQTTEILERKSRRK